MKHIRIAFPTAILMAGLAGTPNPARAHIVMIGDILSRDNDVYGNAQKLFPCDGPRSQGPTYTFEPGATIALSVSEGVPHPSHFRIAFDNDGEDDFIEPKSIDPTDVDPSRPCPYNADDQCGVGKGDYCNVVSSVGGPTVLWDNLDPHRGSLLSVGTEWTWKVTLPNVECENCTIQVLQIMYDTVHGAYCPQGSCTDKVGSYVEDIYHRCINIKLKRGAGGTAGVTSGPVQNKGINCLAGQTATDAGVTPADAGIAPDAGAGNDSGVTGATAGGTAGGGTPGGQAGLAGGVAGAGGGTAGGTSTTGGAAVVPDSGVTPGLGGAAPGGTVGAGTPGGIAGGATGGTLPPGGEDESADDGCDCAVSDRSPRYGNLLAMSLLAAVLLARRRRLQ